MSVETYVTITLFYHYRNLPGVVNSQRDEFKDKFAIS